MRRREFLKTAGSFVATAGVGGLLGCDDADDAGQRPDAGRSDGGDGGPRRYAFAQGVASGDPRPSSVMLWTRVRALDDRVDPIALTLEVATDADFTDRVVAQELEATVASDYTVRVLVERLSPDTIYYYRFTAGSERSRVGRTWTAPEPDADTEVRFVWACCQDFSSGFYGAYRKMLNDDEAAPAAERLRFVLHLGDFVYETRDEEFQMPLDENLDPVMLQDQDGNPRVLPAFPSGGGMRERGGTFARTLDDYRHLYKSFLADADLQDARARWPFVCMWDDHEFSDDAWQTQANYTNEHSTDEPSQRRRLAANQAWFEYIPSILSDAEEIDGVAPHARDFEPASVDDEPYSDVIDVDEPNNAAVLESITVYRRLRFGRHVDLVLTDGRSYRSDHALPEQATDPDPLVFHPRAGLSLEAVNVFDAGSTGNGGNPLPSAGGFTNTRTGSPPGTLLGADQKQWWKDVMAASSATFKVWGNSLPLLRVVLDATEVDLFSGDLVLSADAWDGYPSERRELMTFLRDEGIRNVISLSGDFHAHFAGLVHDDHDAAGSTPVMIDFVTAGISSQSQWASIAGAVETAVAPALAALVAPVLRLIVYDATAFGGGKAVVNFNTLIRYGSGAGNVAAATHDLAMIEAARNPDVNAHLRYVDTAASGYGVARIDGESARIELVTIERPVHDRGEAGAELLGTAAFVVTRVDEGGEVVLDEPELSGVKPFPLE
jgi:alkaline phosphatase D